ncbi:MAG: transcription antitermination protein nusG, partial [Mycobacterium sp.]|nr:transcription antitermination protein nusG [Mycobacterium sp.]
MTSFEGESPSAVSDARIEDADPSTVIADISAETLEQPTAEVVADVADEAPAEVAEEAPAEEAAAEEDEDVDPAVALKKDLRSKPGNWYVIHSYAGYENKVKANLETRVQNLDVGDYIFQVEVPTEEVTEIKNGQRK